MTKLLAVDAHTLIASSVTDWVELVESHQLQTYICTIRPPGISPEKLLVVFVQQIRPYSYNIGYSFQSPLCHHMYTYMHAYRLKSYGAIVYPWRRAIFLYLPQQLPIHLDSSFYVAVKGLHNAIQLPANPNVSSAVQSPHIVLNRMLSWDLDLCSMAFSVNFLTALVQALSLLKPYCDSGSSSAALCKPSPL